MRKYLVRAVRCGKLPVHYYLLVEKGNNGKQMYGISVESGGEWDEIRGITPSRCRICALLKAMIRNRVPMAHARYVVEDWLLE